MWSWNSRISLTLLSYYIAFGPPILIILSVLSSPKKLKLQYSTLWPYLPTLWVFPLPYSSHFTCFLASHGLTECSRFLASPFFSQQCFSFPANPTFPDGLSNSPLSANLDYLASLCLAHIAQENPNLESMLQTPFSIPIATHQQHTAGKSQDVLRAGSTAYSWLQNLSVAPPIKLLTCSWSTPSFIPHNNYSKCFPFCLYPLNFFLSVNELSSAFVSETEIIKWNLPQLVASLFLSLSTSMSVLIPVLQP